MCHSGCDMVLICISLMTNDVEHPSFAHWPFVYLLWINIYSYLLSIEKKILLGIWVFFFKYILECKSLSDTQFANTFSLFVGCLFTFMMVSFDNSLETQARSCTSLPTGNLAACSFFVSSGVYYTAAFYAESYTGSSPRRVLIPILHLISFCLCCFYL